MSDELCGELTIGGEECNLLKGHEYKHMHLPGNESEIDKAISDTEDTMTVVAHYGPQFNYIVQALKNDILILKFVRDFYKSGPSKGKEGGTNYTIADGHTGLSLLRKRLAECDNYAQSWHDNLACCALDEGIPHSTANKIASRFMKLAFHVDTQYGCQNTISQI